MLIGEIIPRSKRSNSTTQTSSRVASVSRRGSWGSSGNKLTGLLYAPRGGATKFILNWRSHHESDGVASWATRTASMCSRV